MSTKVGATFTGIIYDIRTKRDGGGRIQIDFGCDALDEIQWAQQLATKKNCAFQIALVPMRNDMISSGNDEEYTVDRETGEISI